LNKTTTESAVELPARPVIPVYDLHVLDVRQTAAYMQITRQSVLNLLHSGELVGRRAGRPWKIHRDAIRDYLMTGESAQTRRRKYTRRKPKQQAA